MEDWYKISQELILKIGVGMLYLNYSSCPQEFVKDVFPDYEWLPWKFSQVPNGYWEELDNRIYYAKWLGEKLGFRK